MLSWLRQRVKPPRAPHAPGRRRVEEGAAPGPAAVTRGAAATGEDGFAPFARALGIDVPAEPAPASPAEEEAAARLAAQVRERFAASRPAPASFPAIALQILNLAAAPDAEVGELARVVARDPALTAGVLSVANSAACRGVEDVETVREAVARLGLAEVGRVAAAVSARTLFSPRVRAEQAAFGARWTALFSRAVSVGSAAAAQALRHRGANSDRAYLGGLLHDVGKSLALRALAALAAEGALPALGPAELERLLDRVHVELGAEAHQIWSLPQYLTVLCVRHHDEAVPADAEFVDLHLVRLASALAELRAPYFAARAAREVVQSAGALRLDAYAVRALAAELRSAEERAVAAVAARPGTPSGA